MRRFVNRWSVMTVVAMWLMGLMGLTLLFGSSGLREAFSTPPTKPSPPPLMSYNELGYTSPVDSQLGSPTSTGGMVLFSQNKITSDCCSTQTNYSSSTGCVCITPGQMKYLEARGGNRVDSGF